MEIFLPAFILLMISNFLSRRILEKAQKNLETEKKAELIDLFSEGKSLNYGILILVVATFFANTTYKWIDVVIAMLLYIVTIILFMFFTSYKSYKKLNTLGFPKSYIKSYLVSTSLRLFGFALFIILVFSQ